MGYAVKTTDRRLPHLLVPAVLALFMAPALADRAPDATERAAIENKLKAEGYTRWEEIELEDDGSKWEVDDAVHADGKTYDLDLKPGTLEIIKRDLD